MFRKNPALYKISLLSFLFVYSLQSVFAKGLTELLTRERLLKFFTEGLGWMDWVVYFALLLIVTILLKDIGLRNLHALNPRARVFIAMVISFMSVTGFFWVLVQNQIFPHYFVLFAGELLVLAVVISVVVWGFKFKGSPNENVKLGIKIAACLIALLLLNSFHGLIIQGASGGGVATNPAKEIGLTIQGDCNSAAGCKIESSTLLGQIVSLYIDIPLLGYFLIFALLFFILSQGENVEANQPHSSHKKKKEEHDVETAIELTRELKHELKELAEEFNEKSHLLSTLRNQMSTLSHTNQDNNNQGGHN